MPGLLALVEWLLPSGRYRARELVRDGGVSALEFPQHLEAHDSSEARGCGRDDVSMLVATRHDLELVHSRFRELPNFLSAGDLLVVNASATLAAALEARLDGRRVEVRLSTPFRDGTWLVELRTTELLPYPRPPEGARLDLPGGARAGCSRALPAATVSRSHA